MPKQPKYLANTTLETYLQEASDPEKDKFHGCISCHGAFAGSTDLDFQLTNAYPRSSLLSAVHGGVAKVPESPGGGRVICLKASREPCAILGSGSPGCRVGVGPDGLLRS